eukprot:CAMPEP_0119471640 /NCGR_PEP_ID=MMETSP1344-20130328/4023_1 /TAXON_ID=236787 /ORGANISM="Florenciella parvula, Strain CCMP2471" /LENGTH=70 /DNA_ID=CAMNT_0007504449 /DNA_START=93 /DNA_END=305 /DNA_ORIENTATION=+
MGVTPSNFSDSEAPLMACIFGLDGILVDTEQDLGSAARKALAEMIGLDGVAALDQRLFQVRSSSDRPTDQ